MATGTLYGSIQSLGDGEILRAFYNILSGSTTAAANLGGEGELLRAILTQMQTPQVPNTAGLALQPSTATAATMDRSTPNLVANIATVSGTVQMAALYVPANTVVNNINFVTGTTASSGVSNNWACLTDNNRNLLAISANNTTTDLLASAVQAYAVATTAAGASTTFTTTYSGLYYIGFVLNAGTTQPTLAGVTSTASTVLALAPKINGTSNTGVTTPLTFPTQMTALTTGVSTLYGYLT